MRNAIKEITIEDFNNAPIGTKFCESFGSNYQFFRFTKNSNGNIQGEVNRWDYDTCTWDTEIIWDEDPMNWISKIEFQMFD